MFPKIEKITRDVTIVHFLLMFGYKLFSLFYPLFLISMGMTAFKVGWIYLLLYGSIAISALAVNFFIHRFQPSVVASIGILGYGIYSLIMLTTKDPVFFYFAQIVLGISAAFWLVSLKSILIESRPSSFAESFGWFYSAPEYASAAAPAIGALVIWKFGFPGVFVLSFLIQLFNSFYCYFKLKNDNSSEINILKSKDPARVFRVKDLRNKYSRILSELKNDSLIMRGLAVIFIALISGGVYRAFFVLYLENLSFTESDILKFMAALSILFIPLSLAIIKVIGKFKNMENINIGAGASGFAVFVMGVFGPILGGVHFLIFMVIDGFGGLALGAGKSALFAGKFTKDKEEASTLDSIISQAGIAIGGILGGILISVIGYGYTFAFLGAIVLMFALFNAIIRGK